LNRAFTDRRRRAGMITLALGLLLRPPHTASARWGPSEHNVLRPHLNTKVNGDPWPPAALGGRTDSIAREFESSQPSHAVAVIGQCPSLPEKPRNSGAFARRFCRGDQKSHVFGEHGALKWAPVSGRDFKMSGFRLPSRPGMHVLGPVVLPDEARCTFGAKT
jgi:hypothetical protein